MPLVAHNAGKKQGYEDKEQRRGDKKYDMFEKLLQSGFM